MAFFNQGNYTIYERKEVPGDTPLSPQSPTREIATSARKSSVSPRLLATGALIASTAVNVIRSEIEASTGREDLQNTINNTMIAGGLTYAMFKGGLPVVAGLLIKGTADEMLRKREIYRTNYANNLDSKLKGKRNNIGNSSIYYD